MRFSVCLLIVAMSLSGCVFQRSDDAAAAKRILIGKTKEQVLICMGVPSKKAHVEETEVWQYHSSNGLTTGGGQSHRSGADTFTGAAKQKYFCDISIVMKSDQVVAVNYNGPTGGLIDPDEQCGYAVKNCVR